MTQPSSATSSSRPTSQEQYNINLMNSFFIDVQQNGEFDKIDSICHPDYRAATSLMGQSRDSSIVHNLQRQFHEIFADITVEMTHNISNGNIVATNKILKGRLVGEFMGRKGQGEWVKFRGMDFLRIEDGEVRENWVCVGSLLDADEEEVLKF